MYNILVTAAGGAPAINFTRSLKESSLPVRIIGVDADKYTIHRAETDVKELCPKATEDDYIDYLNLIIDKYDIDFIHAQPDIEVGMISENREKLRCKTFLPQKETVKILRDKYLSYKSWESANLPVPKTLLITNEEDLHQAFQEIGPDIWIRAIEGAAGKGSLSSPKFQDALNQINNTNGWGKYTAAEKLTPKSVTWMSIYYHGELIVAQSRERLYWEHGNRAQSGVTGVTGTGRTISDAIVDEIAVKSIFAVDKTPHGIFSVDMTYDKSGVPNLTEINIGKFFTTHYFFTKGGCNFPEIFVELAMGKDRGWRNIINPLDVGLNWIRGMDVEPILISDNEINGLVNIYYDQRKNLNKA